MFANKKISLIAAIDKNNGIGKNGQLLWHLPSDLKWMKQQTRYSQIIMGKNCYLDVIRYSKGKPLPERDNIVLSTRGVHDAHPDFIFFKSIDALEYFLKSEYSDKSRFFEKEKIYILGGQKIYEQFMPFADELIITHVHHQFEADTFFPDWDDSFKKVFEDSHRENELDFTFTIYTKE